MNPYFITLQSNFEKNLSLQEYFSRFYLRVLITGCLVLSYLPIHAQELTTTININLSDVLSIDAESAANGGTVDFNYATVGDYNSEKITTVQKSLVITFSKAFDVKVKANGAAFESGSNMIPVNVMTIRRNTSSTVAGTSYPIILSTENQVLVSGAPLGSKLHLNLDYIIPQSQSSSTAILGKPAGNYTQTITYSASAL